MKHLRKVDNCIKCGALVIIFTSKPDMPVEEVTICKNCKIVLDKDI